MTEGITSLRPNVELNEFFEFMWGSQSGFVYAPLKNPQDDKDWQIHYFSWPEEREQLIQHVIDNTPKWECYYGPSLYKTPTQPIKENILGSNVLWTEFDGNAPKNGVIGDKIPHPTMRVRSSNEGHEHLYWHLDYFETEVEQIETINKCIAYTLHADTSGWDATQILRPPATHNHKRDRVVHTVSVSASQYSKDFFTSLEVPKQLAKDDIVLEEIPDVSLVVAKYKWDEKEFEFFRKREMQTGTRSSALMRLAYVVAEMRMSDEEAYAVLRNADDRWGKFKNRKDQTRRLLDLLNRARHKYPINPESTIESLQTYSWRDLKNLEVHVDWLIPGILQRQGILVISGRQKVGKTQLAINLLRSLATGKSLFNWQIPSPRKVIFVSMEMGAVELKVFQDNMDSVLNDEERELLAKNFLFVPIGHSLLFDLKADKQKIIQLIETEKPEIVCFDSLSKTTMSGLDEVNTKAVMDFADRLRTEYDVSIAFIHHNRKGQIGNKRPKDLDDVYGSFWITATATTVIGMWSDDGKEEIEINCLALRLAEPFQKLVVVRSPKGLQFTEVTPTAIINAEEDNASEGTRMGASEKPESNFNPRGSM